MGFLSLTIGVALYSTARPPQSTYFLPEQLSFYQYLPSYLKLLVGNLPSFIHVFAFSLLTLAVIKSSSKHVIIVCLSWIGINFLFEASQHPQISSKLSNQLDNIHLHPVTLIQRYAEHGTFDVGDFIFASFGGFAAYAFAKFTTKE